MALSYRTPAEEVLNRFNAEDQKRISTSSANIFAEKEKGAGRFFNYHLPPKSKEKLCSAGIYLSPFSFLTHSHPCCKTLENHLLYNVLADKLDSSFFFVGIKPGKLEFLKNVNKSLGSVEAINRLVTSADSYRYGKHVIGYSSKPIFGLESKKPLHLPPETRTLLPHLVTIKARNLFLHDEIHYWSRESLIDFLTILSPSMLVATLVFPPEILAGSPESLNPWCYKFKIDGKKLHFFPDGVMSEAYTQHIDSGFLLKTKRIELPNGNVYGVDLVHNKFSHSVITISEGNFINQEKRFFSNFCAIDFTNIYGLFDKKTYADCLPISYQLVSKIYRYLRTLKKPDQQSAMAKLSQLLDEPTALEIKFVEDFSKLVIDHKSESSMICPSALKSLGFFLGRLLPDKLSRLLVLVRSMSLDTFISSMSEFSFDIKLSILDAHCDVSLGPTYKNFCLEDEQAFVSNFDTALNAKEKRLVHSNPTGRYDYNIFEGVHYPYSTNERELLIHAFVLLLKSFSSHTDILVPFIEVYKIFYANSSRLFYSTDEIGRCYDELQKHYAKQKKGLQRNLRNYFSFAGPVWFLRRRTVRRNVKYLEHFSCHKCDLDPEQELKYFQLVKDIKHLGLNGLKRLLRVDEDVAYWQRRSKLEKSNQSRRNKSPSATNQDVGVIIEPLATQGSLPSQCVSRDVAFLKRKVSLACGIVISVFKLSYSDLRVDLPDQLKNRRAGWFTKPRLVNYSYPGFTHKARLWPHELTLFCEANQIAESYNSVLIQEYNGGAGIPPHADDESIFDNNHPILTVNLKGTCTFGFFCSKCNIFENLNEPLKFEMPVNFQQTHKHSVGNCSKGRISLTFRKLLPNLSDFEMVKGKVDNTVASNEPTPAMNKNPSGDETLVIAPANRQAFFVASAMPVRTSASDDGLDDDCQIDEEISPEQILKDPALAGEITELSRVQNLRGIYKPSELACRMLDESLVFGSMFMAGAAAVRNIESMAGLGEKMEYHVAMARCECVLNAAKARDSRMTYIKGSFKPAENFFGNCVALQSFTPFYFNFLEVINMSSLSEVLIKKDSNCLDRDEEVSFIVARGKFLVVVETLFTVEDLKFAFLHKSEGDTVTFPKSFFRTHTVKFFNILNDEMSTLAVLSVIAEQRVRGPKIEHLCRDGMAVEDIEGVRIDRRNQLNLDDFNVFQVAGDGNCFWSSVALVLGLDAETIKESCRADAERRGLLSNDELRMQFAKNAYAEKEIICACVQFFGLNLFIICESMGFTIEMNPINFEARETVFLLLRDQHYSPILPKNGCVVRAVASALNKPEFKILSLVCKMEDRALYDTLVSGQGLQLAEVERVMAFFDIRAVVRTPEGTFVSNPNGKIPANFELKDSHLLHVTHMSDLSGIPKGNLLSNFTESEAIVRLKSSCNQIEYIPEIGRAKRLFESLQDGTTGVLSSKIENKLPALLDQNRDLNVGNRVLNIMLGTFGSGKSTVYRKAFSELRTHDTFIVSPRKRLANELEVLLGIRDAKGNFTKRKDKGKKREVRVMTFEKFLLHLIRPMTCSVILDEIQLFPPGYVDLIALNLTKKTSLFLFGDPCQSDYDSAGDRSIFSNVLPDIHHILQYASYNFNVQSRRFRTSMFCGRLPCLIDEEELLQDPDFTYLESLAEAKTYDLSHFDVILVSSFEEKKVVTAHFGASFECLTFGESTGLTFDRGIVVISYESIAASERRWVTALSRFRFDLMFLSTTGLTIDEVCLNFEGRFLEKFMTKKASVSDLAELLPGSPQFRKNFGAPIGRDEGIKEARLVGDPWLKTEMFLGQLEDMEVAEIEEEVAQEEWFKTHIPMAELETIRARWVHKIMLKEFREVRCGYEVSNQFTDDFPNSGGEILTNAAERFETIYPRHRGNDSVTFLMAVKKRLKFSQSNVEAAKLKAAEPYGKFMLDEFLKKIPLRSQHNEKFMNDARMEFEEKKVSKSAAILENHSGRSCRDWLADVALIFMKSQLCTKFDNRFRDAKAGQTLACFQHSVLVRFAPYMRYIEKKLFEVLPSNMYIHSGKNLDDLDEWVKKNNFSGVCTESDYEAFDSSQDHFILSFELAVMEFLGLPWDLIEDYRMIKLTLRSKLGAFAIMRFTGEASTFLFNTMANMLFTFLQYDIRGNESICFAGDDMSANKHLIVKTEFSGFLNKLSLKAKVAFTERPTFCGWNLTPHGIYKKPQLVFERLCIAREKNNLNNCLDSYAIEVAYAYSKGELIREYMDEEEIESHYSCVRFIIRHKHLLKSNVVGKFENIA